MIDKNMLLDKFSDTLWVQREKMQEYFEENDIEDFETIYNELVDIRKKVCDFLWSKTNYYTQLSPDKIITLSSQYLTEHCPWINEKGIKSINSHASWYCWHEGIMKTDK
jgi:hypothetical protein